MSENAKTITFVVVGLVAIGIGILTRPSVAEVDEDTLVGKDLKTFDSPDTAKRLRVVKVDEDTAERHEFEVAEQNGLWSIPSKEGYPADAAKQMGEAATSVMGRKILHVQSNNASDHEQYGVIDPLSDKLEPGQKGVGTRVTMWDGQNTTIADLIVGKAVRDAEGQRYVREAKRDAVYVIEIDPSKLSTDFGDWIEKDLLKLNAWELQNVRVKDYSAELVPERTPEGVRISLARDQRADMAFNYNESDGKWTASKLQAYDPKKSDYADFTLAKDEELNEESLNGLKNALGDLKIVDVARKPQGLSNDLKAGQNFMKDNDEVLTELASKGFTPIAMTPGGPREIISSDGEVIAATKNGTQYVLRFGDLTNVSGRGKNKDEKASDPKAKADGKDKKADKGDKNNDVHRYLFVMAQFDESAIKRPEIQKLPELPAKADAAAKQPADAESSKKDEAAKKDEANTKKDDGAKKDEAAKKDAAGAKDAPAPEKDLEKIIAERKRIEKENQTKLDEYQALIKKGQENVKDLNLRFGDWYFVVNDDVFRKIRLSRDKVVKKKEAPKAEGKPGEGTATPGAGIPGLPAIPGASK